MELSYQYSQAFHSRTAYRYAVRMSRTHAPTGYRKTHGCQLWGQGYGYTLQQFLPAQNTCSEWPYGMRVSRDLSGLETSDSGDGLQDTAMQRDSAPPPVVLTQQDLWRWRRNQAWTMILFMAPALSIPLVDPLMSLVDCICIGQYAGTTELAALGPNTIIFSFFQYILTGLCTATVSEVTTQLKANNREKAGTLLATALLFAAGSGTIILLLMKVAGKQMILFTGCSPDLLAPAWSYMRIRALAAPAVLIVMVAQSGLLAQKDSVTPFICIMTQCLVNVVGDVLLVRNWGMGLPGAAWATVAAQLLGAAALLIALFRPGRVHPAFGAVLRRSDDGGKRGVAPKAAQDDLQELGSTFGPATILYLCKTVCYLCIQGTATALHPLTVAAHQPVWQIWNFAAFGHTPLEQAALAYIPTASGRFEERETIKVLLVLGLIVGIMTAAFAAGVPTLASHVFTPDTSLWPIMRSVGPQAFWATLFCSLDVTASGALIATKQLSFLVKAMFATLAVVALYYAIGLRQPGWGLGGVWWGLALFFAMRAVQSTTRLVQTRLVGPLAPAG